ncbi:MAG: DinB family protein [Acidobacteria bacterium]|nr:DinB family protein [Acidobacteriota bacterium]
MDVIRKQLVEALRGRSAHVDFETAVAGFPVKLRGVAPHGVEHTAWELLEHLRLAQRDILEFCTNPKYVEARWPEDYWPAAPAPADGSAWSRSVQQFKRDLRAMIALVADPHTDLSARIPHGSGQTYLREALLVIDHNSYHVGQIVTLRKVLGCWK